MKRLVFLALGMFAVGVDRYIIAGLLPDLGRALHASLPTVGQGVTAFDLAYLVSAPVFAVLLARKPARRVLVTALSVFVLGNVMTALSTSVPAYFVSRAIAGIGTGLFTPTAVATATALMPGPARGRALSVVWGANSAGTVVGVPAGLWLAEKVGWQAAIGVTVALGLVTLAGLAMQPLDVRVGQQPSLQQRVRLLADRRVLATIGVTLLTATGSLGLYTYITSLPGGTEAPLSLRLGAWAAGGLVGSMAIGEVIDRLGHPQRVMAAILTVLVAAIAVLPLSSSFVPYFIWGAMGWATVTAQISTLLEALPDQGATLVALNGSAIGLGSALGSGLGGFAIASGLAPARLPFAAATILVCALACQVIFPKRMTQRVLA